ncbi:MAG: tetratricopeptide repeat protein [Myxococcales bacterium]|nr:tetratricopeptide repeat protein [Myxococcales bacterium]
MRDFGRPLRRSGPLAALGLALALTGCGASPAAPAGQPDAAAFRAFTEAGLLERQGRLHDAARRYDEATALDPDAPSMWLAAARAHARLGQWAEAAERARRAHALAPEDPDAAAALGEALVAQGQLEAARAFYAESLEAHPDRAALWYGRGRLDELAAEPEAAVRAYEKATTLDPTLTRAWYRLGLLLAADNRSAAAAQALDRAVTLEPDHPDHRDLDKRIVALALDGGDRATARRAAGRVLKTEDADITGSLMVATILVQQKDLLAAANELEWLIAQHPDEPRPRMMLAQVLLQVGRGDEARAHLEAVPEDAEERLDALRLIGLSLLSDGRFADAVPPLQAAHARAPDRADVLFELARALRAAERLDEARLLLARGTARFGEDANLHFLLGLVIQAQGDEAGAMLSMKRVIEIDPDHAGALNYVGYTWADRGEHLEQAEDYIRRALRSRPEDGAVIDSLGWVLFRRGKLAEAEVALRRAVKADPEEGEIHFHLAEVLAAQGRKADALTHYDLAVQHARDDATRAQYAARRAAVQRGKGKKTR